MAEVLQRSLLPASLPELAELEVATRYVAAVRGTAAGGDWYDLHRLADGRVDALLANLIEGGGAGDDIAVVAVRLQPRT
jgi:serine phosphatase RsbU (regulator of sigma subunit)